ncbi:hypothetical protein HOY82DRAFT_536789 [Tuber indicum]|nr:hypothetical protein HOY82DRAFT_536789 [Tuber indicum]
MEEERKEYKRVVERKKVEHWKRYLEGLKINEGFKWVKGDRDFVVDLPLIEVEGERRVEGDVVKGAAIILRLGKREDEDQKVERGKIVVVELEEEEVEEVIGRQKDNKAVGNDRLGGKVWKRIWGVEGGRKTIVAIYKESLELGYVPERYRESVGIIMRKLKKEDYGLPGSYRVINLLDMLGKGLERLVCGRLERWGQEGIGDE